VSRGKHVLIRLSGGLTLLTHPGMRGSWHVRHAGRAQPGPARGLLLDAGDVLAICHLPLRAALLGPRELGRDPGLRDLGPDLASPLFDADEALRRLRARGDEELGVALLRQNALAGLGNVYKSELCFLAALDPFARVAEIAPRRLAALVAEAVRRLRRNLARAERRTTSSLAPGPLWVYGRANRPCRRCGTRVVRRMQGDRPRATYLCPRCQG
jgi:endonuclease-8